MVTQGYIEVPADYRPAPQASPANEGLKDQIDIALWELRRTLEIADTVQLQAVLREAIRFTENGRARRF